MYIKQYDDQYKLLIIGDVSVGKTSILNRFVDSLFYVNYVATIGIDYKIKNIILNNKVIRLQIWDTAGQERFRTITAAYFRKAMGILLVYDITDLKSFQNVTLWLQNIQTNAPEDIQLIILANKCDLETQRAISTQQGQELAEKYKIKFLEVSAKENINIEEAFMSLAKTIHQNKYGNDVNNQDQSSNNSSLTSNGVDLQSSTTTNKRKPCCNKL